MVEVASNQIENPGKVYYIWKINSIRKINKNNHKLSQTSEGLRDKRQRIARQAEPVPGLSNLTHDTRFHVILILQ